MEILICAEDDARAAVIQAGLDAQGEAADDTRFVVHRIERLASLAGNITARQPEAIFVDLREPSPELMGVLALVIAAVKRPVVVFVDYSDAETTRRAVEAGIAAYVVDGLRQERIRALLALAISRYEVVRRFENELARAHTALRERKLIERAKAIVMEREGLTEQDAYTLLRRSAMSQNRRIADLARIIVDAAAVSSR